MNNFDPWGFRTPYTKNWGWLYILLGLVPFFLVAAVTFYVLSLLMTDEDLYYKKKTYEESTYRYSTLSSEFSKIEVVGEIVPHFVLANEDDKYLPLEFINNTYTKEVSFTDGEKPKRARFEELYYHTEDTKRDFPYFNFNNNYVPAGDSKSSCLHIRTRPKNSPKVSYDKYDSLKNMPQCFGHNEEIWNPEDPVTGINLLVWKEYENEHRGDCAHGIFKLDACWEYSVLTKICIIIHPYNNDPNQGWYFKEGCYEAGSAIKYEKARPGQKYMFDQVPIEVWAHKGPFYEYETSSTSFGADLSYFGWLSRMCWIL